MECIFFLEWTTYKVCEHEYEPVVNTSSEPTIVTEEALSGVPFN